MSTQSVTPDKSQLPLTGKYDGRRNNKGNLDAYNAELKAGPKPKSRKDLAGRRAVSELRRMDQYKKPSQMFRDALEAHNYALAWTIRSDVEARALGKPYVAVNPATERHDAADVSRIAVAINNLQIVNNPERPRLTKQGRPPVLDGKANTDDVSPIIATESEFSPNPHPTQTDGIEAAEKAGTLR